MRVVAGALAANPLLSQVSASGPVIPRAARPLSMPVPGRTGFLGPHQIEYAIARLHRVTMFNRGSNPGALSVGFQHLARYQSHRAQPRTSGPRRNHDTMPRCHRCGL
jgi:hypothetical protein